MTIPLTLRTVKGSKLTWVEADANFTALRDAIPTILPRTTSSVTTNSLLIGNNQLLSITLAKTTDILVVQTDYPAEVRLYNTSAARTADLSRSSLIVPAPGNGLVCQNTTTAGTLVINQDPVTTFANHDNPVTTTGYLTVWNKDTVSRIITVIITHLPKE